MFFFYIKDAKRCLLTLFEKIFRKLQLLKKNEIKAVLWCYLMQFETVFF